MMLIIFILCLSLLLYVFAGYPVFLFCLSLIRGRKPVAAEIFPSVSLIISAYNEQDIIAEKLENCLAIDYPPDKLEIIVASE